MISAAAAWDNVTDILCQRVQEMRSQTPAIPLLVRWTLAAADVSVDTDTYTSPGGACPYLVAKQYGSQSEPCWPVSVEDRSHRPVSAGVRRGHVLGDYLRAVRRLGEDTTRPLLDGCGAACRGSPT